MPKFLLTLILSCVIITPSLAQRKKQKANGVIVYNQIAKPLDGTRQAVFDYKLGFSCLFKL